MGRRPAPGPGVLRARGLSLRPEALIRPADPAAAPGREELLVEMRVNRDSRLVPTCEVLQLEWLLLQNPRADFGPYRRPLPGQTHPGLGMLKEVFGWLVVVAEVLELDGIAYVPSNYHVAAQSRRLVSFVDPRHEAWMQALEELLTGVPLAVASGLVADGKVIIEATGEPTSASTSIHRSEPAVAGASPAAGSGNSSGHPSTSSNPLRVSG